MLYIWGRYFWLIALVLSVFNAVALWLRSRSDVERDPDLGPGYTKLAVGQLTWLNIPWLIMAYGVVFGGVPSLWHYFRPQDGNPYVLAWFAGNILLATLATIWVFSWGGAEMIIRHRAVFNSRSGFVPHASLLKAFCLFALVMNVAAPLIFRLLDVPIELLPLR